jgi:drug/metabolite transporter (DMT)-like permease
VQSASTVVFLLLALGSAVVYGVGDWFGGRAARHQASLVVVVVGQAVSLVLVAGATGLGDAGSPDTSTWLWSAAGGVIGALGIVSLYHGFATGAVTVVAPVSAVVSAVVPVAGGLLIGERPSGLALAGIAVAVVAIGLVSGAVGRREASSLRSVLVAVTAGSCFGLLFLCLERTADGSGMWPLLIARFASVPLLLALVVAGRQRPVAPGTGLRIAVLAGVFDMGANVLYLLAVREGLMSIVAVVVSLYPASTVAMAFAVDRERVTRWQSVGLGLAAAALVLVSAAH